MRCQGTISESVKIDGVGLHGGEPVSLLVEPAAVDTGIVFVRADLAEPVAIHAHHKSVVLRSRQTVLKAGPIEIHTIEHFLAATQALKIDNLRVTMNAAELPAAGGCSEEFLASLQQAKIVDQKTPRKTFVLDETIVVEDGDAHIVAFPNKGGLKISYALDYPVDSAIPSQIATYDSQRDNFAKDLAPARTFCLEEEAKQLREAGFGKGADFENTLVVGDQGVIDNTLRFENEFARHKLLDLLGDLALLGMDLEAKIVASKSGHATNAKLVKKLAARIDELENQGLVQRETGLDIKEILKIIPHRYPFLFLDRVVSIDGFKKAVAIKNVTFNEPQFQGHWPDQPIFPGVLQVEALAQLAGVLFLRRMENTGKVAVLLSIDRIKFRKPVVPGDQLRLECETINIRKKSGKVIGRGTVGGQTTVEAILKFMLMDE